MCPPTASPIARSSVVQLHRIDHARGKGFYLCEIDAAADEMPNVKTKAAVGLARAIDDFFRRLERPHVAHRQDFHRNCRADLLSVGAHVCKRVAHLRDIASVGPHFAGAFDVAGTKRMRGFEQVLADAVGRHFLLARFKPVSEKLHLNVDDAVIVEEPLHGRIADCFGIEDKILMNEAHPRVSGRRSGLDSARAAERRQPPTVPWRSNRRPMSSIRRAVQSCGSSASSKLCSGFILLNAMQRRMARDSGRRVLVLWPVGTLCRRTSGSAMERQMIPG